MQEKSALARLSPINLSYLRCCQRQLSADEAIGFNRSQSCSANPLRVIFLCFVIIFLAACTTQSGPQPANVSVEQRLGETPGVTVLSAGQLPNIISGQVVYVPIYSEIYDFNQTRTFQLTATLSLRNTDMRNPIVFETLDYYNSEGKKVNIYLNQPIQLAPLASTEVVIPQKDTSGGSGANFIVEWRAANQVSDPVIEAIMVSTSSQQGISFISPGRVIQERQQPQ